MGKGELTRQAILEHALGLATRVGLGGVTIGQLANDLGLSKSGLFAHFQSKEALQLQVLELASSRFVDTVLRPALAAPRGEPRLRVMMDRWREWSHLHALPGGCLFVAAAIELDDQPGPTRDRLVALQKDWLEGLAHAVRVAIDEGHFREDLDPMQFAHDLNAIALGYHWSSRLMRDPRAHERAVNAFEALCAAARRPSPARRPVPVRATRSRPRAS